MKNKITTVMAFLLVMVFVLSSCTKNNDISESKTTKNGAVSLSEKEETTTEAQPKYTLQDNLVALTFDDGPGKESTEKILSVLEENNSVATFFTVGYNLDLHPEVTQKAYEMGCEIGNHTKDHKYLNKVSSDEARKQINENNSKIKEITGAECKLLRAPGGFTESVKSITDMPLINWSIDTEDWKYKDATHKDRSDEERTADINRIVNNVMSTVKKGDIILMHDIYNFSADVAAELIPRLVKEGYTLVTVSEMFDAYGVKLEGGKVYRNVDLSTINSKIVLEKGKYIISTESGGLNLRAESNTNCDVLTEIPKGETVEVVESVEGWAKVTYGDKTGWVFAKYLKSAS